VHALGDDLPTIALLRSLVSPAGESVTFGGIAKEIDDGLSELVGCIGDPELLAVRGANSFSPLAGGDDGHSMRPRVEDLHPRPPAVEHGDDHERPLPQIRCNILDLSEDEYAFIRARALKQRRCRSADDHQAHFGHGVSNRGPDAIQKQSQAVLIRRVQEGSEKSDDGGISSVPHGFTRRRPVRNHPKMC
jgi:hypothetical protein